MAGHSRYSLRATLAASTVLVCGAVFGVVLPAGSALAADTASINGSSTFQTMAGFGFSEASGQAQDVMNAPSSAQQQVLNLLFSPTSGAGLNIIRNWIGADPGNTIEPNSPGSPGAAPSYVPLSSINSDSGQLWFDQQAKAGYGVTNVFADAWSAPGYMKTNGSAINGGTLCGVPGVTCSSGDWRQAFANYLVQYAKDYAAAGVPLTYIGPENEANLSTSYDSMQLSPSQTVNLLDILGPALQSSGLSTQVECCAAEGWNFAQQYAQAIEADPVASADTAVFGSHGYTAPPTSLLPGWNKPAWETEWFGTSNAFDAAWDDGTTDAGFTWAQRIYQGLTEANLSAYLFWEGADINNANGGLLRLNSDGTVSVPSRLWAFANYSRYIHPGAVRIGATSSSSGVDLSAYKNTDGSVAVVALNTLSSADSINYSTSGIGGTSGTVTPFLTNGSNNVAQQPDIPLSGGAFSATVPARSLVTYLVKLSGGPGNTVTVTSPGDQSGTVGTPVSLQIQASDSGGQALTYGATGLPAGLSINSSTGLISGTPTTAVNSAVTVTATDSTGASGSAMFNWSITASPPPTSPPPTSPPPTSPPPSSPPPTNPPPGGGSCQVTYQPNNYPGGFTVNVIVANNGSSAITNWTLGFTFPGDQQITNSWSVTFSQAGERVSLTNVDYDATIAPGQTVTFGFQGTWTSNDTSPSSFTLNGTPCT